MRGDGPSGQLPSPLGPPAFRDWKTLPSAGIFGVACTCKSVNGSKTPANGIDETNLRGGQAGLSFRYIRMLNTTYLRK